MKIKLLCSRCLGDGSTQEAGQEITVSEQEAVRLVAAQQAVAIDAPKISAELRPQRWKRKPPGQSRARLQQPNQPNPKPKRKRLKNEQMGID